MTDDAAEHPPLGIGRDDIGRRFCDVVLKGGITSGVVYPKAIARLARQYRFRNIGGTSAGAIAAASAAAAEYRRAHAADPTAQDAGFDQVATLPDFFAQKPDGSPHSNLFHLFRPEARTRRHFAILASVLNRAGPARRVMRGLVETMRQFIGGTIVGALPGGFLAAGIDVASGRGVVELVVCIAFTLAGALTGATLSAVLSLLRALPAQEFGISGGFDPAQRPGQPPALVNWLYPFLQEVAGKDLALPLTFGDLDASTHPDGQKGIALQMMTTALTMGRPMSLPFRVGRFYFKESELARYFPAEVIAWMVEHPGDGDDKRDRAMKEMGYRPLPPRESLPVIVATRMSLAFPILLSAIPLYRHAWEDEIGSAERTAAEPMKVRRVLFSDGGICSNFPLHMFDSMLPAWPTFGFNLRDDLPAPAPAADRAYLPGLGKSLAPEHYPIGETHGPGPVPLFLIAIVKTMQNWRDNLQRAAPGFRDRVVTIRHTPEEGGFNLDMKEDALAKMAVSGQLAADTLVAAFGDPPSLEEDHLTRHRWVRVRSLLAVLQGELREVHEGITQLDNHPTFPELIDNPEPYVGRSYPLRRASRAEAQRVLDALSHLHDSLQLYDASFEEHAPRPEVAMRIQPVI